MTHDSHIFMKNKQKKLKRLRIAMIVIGVLLIGTIVYAARGGSNHNEETSKISQDAITTPVQTVVVGSLDVQSEIQTSGIVRPQTEVDVVALTSGTVRSLLFQVGDTVSSNQLLASLQDSALLTNLNTAQSSYQNAQNSLQSVARVTDESIRSAEINVQNAEESVRSAEIALKTAQDSLTNNSVLITQTNADTVTNAVIGYAGDLNTLHNMLTQVNYIIHADESQPQLSGIAQTLGVLNSASVNTAKATYWNAKNAYNSIASLEPTEQSIVQDLQKLITVIQTTQTAINDTITVLDNTIANSSFSESALNTQKTNFTTYRSTLLTEKTSTQQTIQTLNNIDINTKLSLDALDNAVASAENKLRLAEIAYTNALTTLASARESKRQQVVSAQSAVDSAQGQLRLTSTQVSDLSVRTPIRGTVTQRYVEVGTEVSPGQKIATVSQHDLVKIEVSLNAEDAYRIHVGDAVMINDTLTGTITHIDPSADPVSRKVGVEIHFDNTSNELIANTFARITIPIAPLVTTSENSFFVPIKAVVVSTTESYVLVVSDDVAHKRTVTTGRIDGARIEVTDGLQSDDVLIIEGGKKLEEGDAVTILQ